MIEISRENVIHYNISGPRYTSYPTADRFVDAFGADQYIDSLVHRRSGINANNMHTSLYVHLPFCASICYYCACNKIITKQYDRSVAYMHLLEKELKLIVSHLGTCQKLTQLHFGGGTPTYYKDNDLIILINLLKKNFVWEENGEFSIEIDPRTVDPDRLRSLKQLGFNRISLGVQDFEPIVQKAVNRVQSFDLVQQLTVASTEIGFKSINFDLIYGLPFQTIESFSRTLDLVIRLKPNRIALYAYAHLPQKFKPQRKIHTEDLPIADIKINMLMMSINKFEDAGYIYIGMDHFALPDDSLAIAKQKGTLQRNFQGYSTQSDMDIIPLGISAIGKVGAVYCQNTKDITEYADLLTMGKLPIVKGLVLTRDDLLRRTIIMGLMCQGIIHFDVIETNFLINFRDYFSREIELLNNFEFEKIIVIKSNAIEVTTKGWYFVRAIAMVFDRYLRLDTDRSKFSKII